MQKSVIVKKTDFIFFMQNTFSYFFWLWGEMTWLVSWDVCSIKEGTKYHLNTLLNNYNHTEKRNSTIRSHIFHNFFSFQVLETTTASLCELQYMRVCTTSREKKHNPLDCAVPTRAQEVSEATPRLI